ncbi:MAG: hypothetical protein JWO60_3145 [Frankiales bacterium]|nr:hypothetical protein [Frankiales bacterium]
MALTVAQLVVALAALVLNVYVAIDARATPRQVFDATGHSRTLWMTLSLVGAFLLLVGVALAGWYLLRVRPDLRRELAVQGLEHEVSPRTKAVRYLLPGLALAVAVALGARAVG